jgi:hypothetical protein
MPSLSVALAGMLALASCSTDKGADDEAGTTTVMGTTDDADTNTTVDTTNTTVDTTNTSVDTSTEGNPDTSTDPTVTTNEGGSFYAGPSPDAWPESNCDPFAQDCPEGEKCVAYAANAGSWDANKCVPVLGTGQPGDPCIYDGVLTSTDDCGSDSFCFNADDRGQGTCTAFCQGTADVPECQDGSTCYIGNDGSLTLCLALCDPLLQDCEPGLGCYWLNNTTVACVEAGQAALGDACEWLNGCAPGLLCVDGALLPTCEGGGDCCTSFCELANPACEPGSECVPLFEPGEQPDYDHVGVCVAP